MHNYILCNSVQLYAAFILLLLLLYYYFLLLYYHFYIILQLQLYLLLLNTIIYGYTILCNSYTIMLHNCIVELWTT